VVDEPVPKLKPKHLAEPLASHTPLASNEMVRYNLLCVGAACTAKQSGIEDMCRRRGGIRGSGRNHVQRIQTTIQHVAVAREGLVIGLNLASEKELPYKLCLACGTANLNC
jgi:hypothetical protein